MVCFRAGRGASSSPASRTSSVPPPYSSPELRRRARPHRSVAFACDLSCWPEPLWLQATADGELALAVGDLALPSS